MFSHSALLWFFPLLVLAVLIHLINLHRHKRIRWAAMEFLLLSYKRSRTRILLQQILLLLLRLAALAALILMFADPKVSGTFAGWFGEKAAHYIILLDDSFSMNDRDTALSTATVFDEGINTIRKIIAGKNSGMVTIITSSNKSGVHNVPLNTDGHQTLENVLSKMQVSNLSTEPETLLAEGTELVRRNPPHYKPAVFFLSDFRRRNWQQPQLFLKHIESIRQLGGEVRMIRLSDTPHRNLTVETLELAGGIHAAEVEMLLDANVANWSNEAAENVSAEVYVDGQLQLQQMIPKIPAGGKTQPPLRLPIRLSKNKPDVPHQIELRLEPDALPDDNRRFLALQVPDAVNVLLVSVKPNSKTDSQNESQYVRSALSPPGIKSGVRTRIEEPEFLLQPDALSGVQAVFMLDVPALESAAVKALEQFVNGGGGLVFFTGSKGNIGFIRSELYKNGGGLFPVSPIDERELLPDLLSNVPDMKIAEHPVFRLFNETESPLLTNVKIEKYLAADIPADGAANGVAVLATLRNGAPLVLEKKFGKGRTITFLTSASPDWNNWGRGNPGYVVVMLELAAYLTQNTLTGNVSEDNTQTQESVSGLNVEPSEGDIRLADVTEIADILRTIHQPLENVRSFQAESVFRVRRSVSDWLLAAVVLLLIGETFLAGRLVN
ncbi:MAG: BatA domain-containing protein [Planctomycetaceae bacterium]|jgi:uncharacterized membrane protein|nr:BatA domain-containing protein [Planctomycetaceae bacterium]